MALYKEFTKPNGIISSYHRIDNFYIEALQKRQEPAEEAGEVEEIKDRYLARIALKSYVSQEIRNISSELEIESAVYGFYIPLEELETTPVLSLLYGYIKTLPAYEDAIDI